MQSRTNLRHPIQRKCQSKVFESYCPIRNNTHSIRSGQFVAKGIWCWLVTSTKKVADSVTFQGFCQPTEPGTVYRRQFDTRSEKLSAVCSTFFYRAFRTALPPLLYRITAAQFWTLDQCTADFTIIALAFRRAGAWRPAFAVLV